MRSTLGRVRGLGSAHRGFGHWWGQRLTALALVFLLVWFVASLISLIGVDYAVVVRWISQPFDAIVLSLMIVALFHHAQLGLQVVIEDYIHHEAAKLIAIYLVKASALALGLACLWAIGRVAFGAM